MHAAYILLQLLGTAGAVLFYGRFYMQWIASEMQGRSVVPEAFWYMSGFGSVSLLLYGVFSGSPLGALSHCFNVVIYSRNLVHIWREKGVLTPTRSRYLHSGIALLVLLGIILVAYTWTREYHNSQNTALSVQTKNWVWLAVGVFGQGLFALRFLIQWAVTELHKKSIIPAAFWYISVVACLLMMLSHIQREEWLYVIGLFLTLFIYLRNIYLVHYPRSTTSSE
ncbi:MAG: lipid-A-disaccharide synthase N-terminal domain-containing protein [Candidatus Hydrogenedentes bacterium]|nr:lipid-A-disaccharide synthase N-terminal domain-containing protein [Candidatus Hydrogenedentota bacterium]